jgi:hypothetical protein
VKGKHRRVSRLTGPLVRATPPVDRVPCRDRHGHRAWLEIHSTPAGVVIVASHSGALLVPGLAIGRLRAALRAAVLSVEPTGLVA